MATPFQDIYLKLIFNYIHVFSIMCTVADVHTYGCTVHKLQRFYKQFQDAAMDPLVFQVLR